MTDTIDAVTAEVVEAVTTNTESQSESNITTVEAVSSQPSLTAFGMVLVKTYQGLAATHENVTIGQLAEATGKNPFATSKGVEKLVRDGYATISENGGIHDTIVKINENSISISTESVAPVKMESDKTPKAKKDQPAEKIGIDHRRYYQFLKHPEKGAPQLLTILNTLKSLGGETNEPVLGSTLFDALDSALETVQPAVRVFKYYQKTCIAAGYIREFQPSEMETPLIDTQSTETENSEEAAPAVL